MNVLDVFKEDKSIFDKFDKEKWFRYTDALNHEVPVDELDKKPYFLKLTDNEKKCYQIELDSLVEERKSFPQASYGTRYKDLD